MLVWVLAFKYVCAQLNFSRKNYINKKAREKFVVWNCTEKKFYLYLGSSSAIIVNDRVDEENTHCKNGLHNLVTHINFQEWKNANVGYGKDQAHAQVQASSVSWLTTLLTSQESE